ncbi:MAG: protein phosphatase CheZ [Beijerinckiaceae bacterium]
MTAIRKTFTIEKSSGVEPVTETVTQVATPGPGLADVMVKLEQMSGMIQPTQAIVANIAEAYRREVTEVMKLKTEMDAIQQAILETKRHVISIHAAGPRLVTVHHAAGELGAVVLDTESATNNILAAAERIEMMAGVIQSEKTMEAMKSRADEIAAMVMSIYEACNFQDLTGQRISRVCETLSFVEERIGRMAGVWGGLDQLTSIMSSEIEAIREEQKDLGTHALAAGPAMVGADGHVDQTDIDALFD